MLMLALIAAAYAETAWVSWSEVLLVRWPEATQLSATYAPGADGTAPANWPGTAVQSGKLSEGAEVEVLLRDGALARVRKGTDMGWVPGSALSATKVVAPMDFPFDLSGGLPPGLSFPGAPPAAPQ